MDVSRVILVLYLSKSPTFTYRRFHFPMNRLYRRFRGLVLPVCMLAVLAGCGHGGSHRGTPASEADTIDRPHDNAFRMWQEKRPFEECIAEQLRAVRELREGKPTYDPVEILSQTGHMYMRHGDYLEAMKFLQEASDSVKVHAAKGCLTRNDARVHGSLGALYVRFGLFEEALRENELGIRGDAATGYNAASDFWRFRHATYVMMIDDRAGDIRANADSALYALDMASGVLALMPDGTNKAEYMRRNRSSRADFFILHPDLFPDSIDSAIASLDKAVGAPDADYYTLDSDKAVLGRGKVLRGDYAEGLPLMEEALSAFRTKQDSESVEWLLNLLADSYVWANKPEMLLKIYPGLAASRDSLVNKAKANAVIGADFRYRLKEAEQARRILAVEREDARKLALYEGLALALGLIVGAVAMWLVVRRLVKAREDKERLQRSIDEILTRQQLLNATIEDLNRQLSRHTRQDSAEVVEKVTGNLSPTLLCGEDESEFRRAFASLHPGFLRQLRADFPTLTPNDELVCMLIYLKNTSIDIALCLGISRASLNSVRYRIRKKMALDKETDLDTFICSR